MSKSKKEFRRGIDQSVFNEMTGTVLWNEHLKDDCKNHKIFLTTRPNDVVSFYHEGGKVFSFEKKDFKTHIKYAAVINKDKKKNKKSSYLTEIELKNPELLIQEFAGENYESIKENCKNFSKGTEEEVVSKISCKNSYLSKNDIVVLDVEISFKRKNKIDILLYDKSSKTLKFVEAKLFKNQDIRANSTKAAPLVCSQIERYQKVIEENQSEIITAYTAHIDALNKMFDVGLEHPEKVDCKVALLIFYDNHEPDKQVLAEIKSKIEATTINEEKIKVEFLKISDINNDKLRNFF